jgi:hypothetical protein
LIIGTAAPAAAQSYPLDKCDTRATPVGYLRANGIVRYTLRKDGTVADSTLVVLAVDGMGVRGFQSAAARQLSTCRMHRPPADIAVVQVVRFDSAAGSIAPAAPATGNETILPLAEAPAADTIPRPGNDSALDERPRWIDCDRAPHAAGSIMARVIIGSDGRVVPHSVSLVRSYQPAGSSSLLRALTTCRFVPGRMGGTPVPTTLIAGIISSGNGYTVTDLPVVDVLMRR